MSYLALMFFSLVSGFSDAKAFDEASRIWTTEGIDFRAFVLTTVWFNIGIFTYIIAVRFMGQVGIYASILQFLIWLVIVISFLVVSSPEFRNLPNLVVMVIILIGVTYLTIKTG